MQRILSRQKNITGRQLARVSAINYHETIWSELFPGNYTVIVHTAKGDVTVRDVILAEARTTKVILSREEGQIKTRIGAAEGGKK